MARKSSKSKASSSSSSSSNSKKKNKKERTTKDEDADKVIVEEEDERFAAAYDRPHFRGNNKTKRSGSTNNKIVLDERFASVLTDPRFQLQEKDKYGRKNKNKTKRKKSGTVKNELDAFYTIASSDEKENHKEDDDEKPTKDDDNNNNNNQQEKEDDDDASTASSSSSSSDSSKKEEDQDPASRISYLTALSRGELDVSSSSSSDDDDSDDEDSSDNDDSSVEEDPIRGTVGILDPSTRKKEEEEDVEITYDDSRFVAVTNLDWTHIRAMDIFAILSSFAAPGSLKRVQVFVSDYGKEKMAHEMQHGPPSLWKKKKDKQNKNKKMQSTGMEEDEENDDDDSSSSDASDNQHDDDNDNDDDSNEVVDYEGMDEDAYAEFLQTVKEQQQIPTDSDFDPEKLRAYEASKLKYYFAVAEFETASAADVVYKQVDGMEFEHSSAAVDLRSIPPQAVGDVVQDRQLRDEATSLPGNYVPPEFIVSALQQSNVQCTWEAGDVERERMLTKYNSSAEQWASLAENDDLKAYLASDNDDSSQAEDSGSDNGNSPGGPKAKKGAKLRKLLGLDADSDGDDDDDDDDGQGKEEASDQEAKDKEVTKEIRYIPGNVNLQEKIRTKLQTTDTAKDKDDAKEQLTPWEKYQQKRKEKRKERRQAARRKRSDIEMEGGTSSDRNKAPKQKQSDSFFMEENDDSDDDDEEHNNKPSKQEELELLLAGDNDEEVAKDFDMRGLRRIDKNKDKKLSKSRKRKEEKLAAGVSGQDFAIDLKDSRFAAVLDGEDGRFGIDRTDPQYKETPAMREILDEQRARRKKKRRKMKNPTTTTSTTTAAKVVPPNVVEGSGLKNAGSAALSSLVKSLKTKVAR